MNPLWFGVWASERLRDTDTSSESVTLNFFAIDFFDFKTVDILGMGFVLRTVPCRVNGVLCHARIQKSKSD